jgi:hypothetical protein
MLPLLKPEEKEKVQLKVNGGKKPTRSRGKV